MRVAKFSGYIKPKKKNNKIKSERKEIMLN